MSKIKKLTYKAQWRSFGRDVSADETFTAKDDKDASKQANKIAAKLKVTKIPRVISQGTRTVSVLMTGVSPE